MQNLQNKTIREIAVDEPLTIRIFENHKIDFCCAGRVPFEEACEKAGADPVTVLSELEEVFKESSEENSNNFENARLADLIDHIVCKHHDFTRSEFERLAPLADKVATRHGDHHPELLEIRDLVHALGDDMYVHMHKEEMMLFPYIEKLERAVEKSSFAPISSFGTVQNPVRMMIFEHDQAGDMLRKVRALSSDYKVPEGACPSYQGLYAGLEFIEKDLHQHIHLENNILFPKAIEMECTLYSDALAA